MKLPRDIQIELHIYNLGVEKSRAAYRADRAVADGFCANGEGRRRHERKRRCLACIRSKRSAP